ncbi:vWA domain-containing protein [Bifidobacterium pullorum]
MDLSPMSNSDSGKLQSLLEAMTATINQLMGTSKNNRVALIGYSNTAVTLLPLAHYKPGSVTMRAQRLKFTSFYKEGTDPHNEENSCDKMDLNPADGGVKCLPNQLPGSKGLALDFDKDKNAVPSQEAWPARVFVSYQAGDNAVPTPEGSQAAATQTLSNGTTTTSFDVAGLR